MRQWMLGAAGAALAFTAVALLGAGAALSSPGRGGCHEGAPRARLEERLDALALAPETRAAAEQVLAQARSEGQERWTKLRDARRALRDLLAQDSPALEPVLAQADAIGALETERLEAKLRTMLQLRSVLGPEVWQQLRDTFGPERGAPLEKS